MSDSINAAAQNAASVPDPLSPEAIERRRQEAGQVSGFGEKPEARIATNDYLNVAEDVYVDFTPDQDGDEIHGIKVSLPDLTRSGLTQLFGDGYVIASHIPQVGGTTGEPYTDDSGRTLLVLKSDLPKFEAARDLADIASLLPGQPKDLPEISGTCSPNGVCENISTAEVHHVIMSQHIGYIRAEYARLAAAYRATHGHLPQGDLTVKFVIAKDGTVSSVTEASSSLPTEFDAAFGSQVNRRLFGAKFSEPRGGGIAVVHYTFSF